LAFADSKSSTDIPSIDLAFDTDSSLLPPDAGEQLGKLATWVKCTPSGTVILEGHADVRGTWAHNMKLSGERAEAVRDELVRMRVPADRIVVTIYGETGPRRGTLAADRRVTIRAVARAVRPDDIIAQR
jgi:outer membrane protein OmpA-like peptidoglycan-associated protein